MRPDAVAQHGLMFEGDDDDYFAHATAITFGHFPSYDLEVKGIASRKTPLGSVGPAIMALPFVFAGSLIDRVTGSPIIEKRTKPVNEASWSLFGFVVAANVYFWLGCYFLFEAVKRVVGPSYAAWSVILMVLVQGIPLFAVRRPVFSHIFAFFLQSLAVYVLIKTKTGEQRLRGDYGALTGLGLLCGLISLVRYNNAFIAIFWPFILLTVKGDLRNKDFWKQIGFTFFIGVLPVLIFRIIPNIINQHVGYVEAVKMMFEIQPPLFYLKRIIHIFCGYDWGLIFTAPFAVIALVTVLSERLPLRKYLLYALVPILFNLYGTIMYKTQGGWYGYRYLIPSLVPILVLPFAIDTKNMITKYGKKVLVIFFLTTLTPLLSMLCFQGNSRDFELQVVEQYFGATDWGHNTYQKTIWQNVIRHPNVIKIAISRGGIFYLKYLTTNFEDLPYHIKIRYLKQLSISDHLKIATLYVLPLLLYFLVCCREWRRHLTSSCEHMLKYAIFPLSR